MGARVSPLFEVNEVETLQDKWIRGFHKLFSIQECQYCHFCSSCAIWNLLDHLSVQPWNVILLYPVISNCAFTNTNMIRIKKGPAKVWEYANDNDATIANFVDLWKLRVCFVLGDKLNFSSWGAIYWSHCGATVWSSIARVFLVEYMERYMLIAQWRHLVDTA